MAGNEQQFFIKFSQNLLPKKWQNWPTALLGLENVTFSMLLLKNGLVPQTPYFGHIFLKPSLRQTPWVYNKRY